MGVDIRLGVRKTMGSRGNCREFENMYPVWKGKLSFGIMLLCENASPVGPKLLILRKSQKPHFGVKFSDFYMLATISNLAVSTKENMLNEWIYALNIGIPHSHILVSWLFLYILFCTGSSTIMILTPSDELKISISWPGISCDIQIDRSSYLLGIILACSISCSSSTLQTWAYDSPDISSTLSAGCITILLGIQSRFLGVNLDFCCYCCSLYSQLSTTKACQSYLLHCLICPILIPLSSLMSSTSLAWTNPLDS